MPSSNNQRPGSTIINHELDVFYDTPIVCDCSKCKVLKKNPQHVTLSHYINDRLPKVDNLLPLSVVKNPIGDIGKTHRDTSIFSFFDNLEARQTKFHPKFTNSSPSIKSNCYNRALYCAWSSSILVLDVGTKFSFCGNSYMISKCNINVSNLGLFILSHVFVPPKQLVALMSFCGPLYSQSNYSNIVKYKHRISMHNM